ncbi:MAG: hypothetical protein NTX61_17845 [Bacteroidetes bacterium]|nr:hypothetical protein [Bacteroidota bacterium]
MKVIDLLRLLRKHIVLLLITPIVLALIVAMLTRHPSYRFSSETILYTGIASGTTVEMDKSYSFFATNTAFDNLINIIKSRETQQEVAVRLLAQHLMFNNPDPKYITKKSFDDLRKITPPYIQSLVVKYLKKRSGVISEADTSLNTGEAEKTRILQPPYLDPVAYEQTVDNLMDYMEKNDTNFVYGLLNFNNQHYSINAISSITVVRISSSDLVKIHFESDDPGICQQTLAILTGVCIMNYKNIKENRSDAVVKYFENQVSQASGRLKVAEDKLLKFNEDNNIINYYEQSKAVAVVKEDLDVDYHNKRIRLAGIDAAIKRIEEKLKIQQQVQLNNTRIIDKRNQLADINFKIANAEIGGARDSITSLTLGKLKLQAETLKDEIRNSVNELYKFGTSTEGLPISSLLTDWINNVIDYEEIKAGLEVLGDRIKEFQKQYAAYAPAGANLKRIEREISVSEQEFLELLHGLNLAKLKMQDAELSSNIKAVDLPYYPLSPNPTKRKILIIIAAVLGFLIVFTTVLIMEYFDDTLKNPAKTSKILDLSALGIFPKIFLRTGAVNFPFVTNRLLEMIIQQIDRHPDIINSGTETKTLVFVSTLSNEGKTIVMGNLARKMKSQGKRILVLKFSRESLRRMEVSQTGYPENPPAISNSGFIKPRKSFIFLNHLLGYPDTRVDPDSPFLQTPDEFLSPEEYALYSIDTHYFSLQTYHDLFENNNIHPAFKPDYILIEIPALLYYSYPPGLIANCSLPILVCRSNRIWREADRNVLETFIKVSGRNPRFLLNGVELNVIESYFGELLKKRSWLRRIMKKVIRFEFFSRQQP